MTSYLSIAHDFSPAPAGRVPTDGPFNGQRFREEFLVPRLRQALDAGNKLIVDFADADSYSSSFLEEAFGGLARSGNFNPQQLRSGLIMKSDDPVYAAFVKDAQDYLDRQLQRSAA